MHQSFVDRGANGGLAGSDVRVFNIKHISQTMYCHLTENAV